jgi:hypothetical protein
VIYTSTKHYKKNFVSVTWTVMLFVIILKFIIDASFAQTGALSAAIAPMIMYVIFNVGWMKINYISFLNIFLHLITIAVYAEN